jgi:hypothetical protein
MEQIHYGMEFVHRGENKMLAIIKDKKIAILKAKKLAGEICLDCIRCRKFPKSQAIIKSKDQAFETPTKILQDVSVDLIGPPNPKSNLGYIIVIIDRLTQYCWQKVKKTTPTPNDILLFLMEICEVTGLKLERILSDRGPQFRHKKWQRTLNTQNI